MPSLPRVSVAFPSTFSVWLVESKAGRLENELKWLELYLKRDLFFFSGTKLTMAGLWLEGYMCLLCLQWFFKRTKIVDWIPGLFLSSLQCRK